MRTVDKDIKEQKAILLRIIFSIMERIIVDFDSILDLQVDEGINGVEIKAKFIEGGEDYGK